MTGRGDDRMTFLRVEENLSFRMIILPERGVLIKTEFSGEFENGLHRLKASRNPVPPVSANVN